MAVGRTASPGAAALAESEVRLSSRERAARLATQVAPYAAIVLVGLIVHGLLLLNDGTYWDDWLGITALKARDWQRIWGSGLARGEPIDALFGWFFVNFTDIHLAHHIVSFACIIGNAALVYAVCEKLGYFRRLESLWIALASLVYPAFQTQILLATANYLFYYLLFMAAVWLALHAEQAGRRIAVLWRLAALLLFFVSFSLPSLLVFYLGFFLILAIYARRLRALSWNGMLSQFLPRHIDYLILPGLFWFIKITWFPTRGLYADYNQIGFDSSEIPKLLNEFWLNGIYHHFRVSAVALAHQPLVLIAVLATVLAVAFWTRSRPAGPVPHPANTRLLIGYGLLLLALAIAPYVAVGATPSPNGWNTRHSLLLGLPIAVLIMSAAATIAARSRYWIVAAAAWTLLVALLSGFGVATIGNYVAWQARSVVDHALMQSLSNMPGAGEYSIYWVNNHYNLGGDENVQFYEYASMFKQIWGGETRVGYDAIDQYLPPEVKRQFPVGYNIKDLDPAGCQATLLIWRAKNRQSMAALVWRYLYYRYRHPERMATFLAGVAKIQLNPYPSPLATHCHPQPAASP